VRGGGQRPWIIEIGFKLDLNWLGGGGGENLENLGIKIIEELIPKFLKK
jgi:hypothetical protein